ncbi:hypothetical protein AKI39_12910 [Bordetella sp. H567]|nr:hypothetical protein AKI39_12910 [Bordetella sp. H567]
MPPQDITWTRMAFSPDMVDTNFGDMAFSPKWRSSLAVYYYVVPEEETADTYPNSRLVYLRLTCSLTGWNPSEALRNAQTQAQQAGNWDDLQRTLWETIIASGWAEQYWPCLGAIMQIAVYPHNADGVAPDDYPYFLDFEPKKRELYETVTEGSEMLSASANTTSITKGNSSTNSLEIGASAGFSVGPFGASGSVTSTWADTTVNQNTTDTSREARETLSRTTSTSQMYQLFNGYHLGTNRALFVVAPRPHTVSNSAQTEFNLIDGERNLEGIQDVFLVVHMPRALDGLCIQAGLDTGHQAPAVVPYFLVSSMQRPNTGNGNWPPPDPLPPTPPVPPTPTTPWKQLVVTRRIIQSCGTFDANGNLALEQLREPLRPPVVTGEFSLPDRATVALARTQSGSTSQEVRAQSQRDLNVAQSQVRRQMLNNISSGNYQPRPFEQTGVFRSLVAGIAMQANISLADVASKGFLDAAHLPDLQRAKITTLSQLFATTATDATAGVARQDVLDRFLKTTKN